jgi:hypothetical protein
MITNKRNIIMTKINKIVITSLIVLMLLMMFAHYVIYPIAISVVLLTVIIFISKSIVDISKMLWNDIKGDK